MDNAGVSSGRGQASVCEGFDPSFHGASVDGVEGAVLRGEPGMKVAQVDEVAFAGIGLEDRTQGIYKVARTLRNHECFRALGTSLERNEFLLVQPQEVGREPSAMVFSRDLGDG